ncbi:MAG: hypothetical protein AAFX03_13855 [Pseudomonadota bacterium]
MKRFTLVAASATLAAFAASAGDFSAADVNQDGVVSLLELRDVKPDATAATFPLFDTDRSGALDVEEFAAAIDAPPPPKPEFEEIERERASTTATTRRSQPTVSRRGYGS